MSFPPAGLCQFFSDSLDNFGKLVKLMPSSSAKQDDDLGDKKASLDAKEPTQTDYIIAGVAYSICAATLLVINKAAVDLTCDITPSPAVVVASQLGLLL